MSTSKDTAHVNTVSLSSEERAFPDPRWNTGMWARFPWTGFVALSIIVLCAVGSVVVLLVSRGKTVEQWSDTIAPSILLSGFNGVANICFGVAIGNGVAITWWRKALKGATIQELHRSWTFSSSIKDIVLGGKYFNVIALAALAAKLTIIDGMLMQRAAVRRLGNDHAQHITTTSYANNTMPYTGIIGDRSGNVSTYLDWFDQNLDRWSTSNGIFGDPWLRCDGTCNLDIEGIGFEFDCSSEEIAMDYGAAAAQAALDLSRTDDLFSSNEASQYNLLDVSFQVIYGAPGLTNDHSIIIMNVTSTNATSDLDNPTSCPGTRYQHSCILRPALIKYPVSVEDIFYTDTLSPWSNMYLGYNTTSASGHVFYHNDIPEQYNITWKQQTGFSVLSYKDVFEDHLSITTPITAIGGVAKALNDYLAGTSSMHYDAGLGYRLDVTGSAGNRFKARPKTIGGCDFSYGRPLDVIVQQINMLMFSLAVDPWRLNRDNNDYKVQHTYNATQYKTSLHYQTEEGFMWGAFGCMLVCVICVLPSYWGYWQLGRDVTLGPFEIANAFRAPILDCPAVANAGVKELIREVGKREVKYGEMVRNDAPGRLAIAEVDAVRRVHPSIHDRSG
jgi:hypothetical protein